MSPTAEQRVKKAAQFRATPPVGRRMAGHLKRRKRDPERVGDRTIGEKLFRGIYLRGPKRVDKNRTRKRGKRARLARTAKNSRRVNRLVASGALLPKLSRPATRFDWAPSKEKA